MAETLAALEERLERLNRQGAETTEKVDVLIEVVEALGSNDPKQSLALSQDALALAERLSYQRGRAYALGYMGFSHHLLSQHEAAYAHLREAVALLEDLGDLDGQAMALGGLAGVQLSLGHYEESIKKASEALKLLQRTGNRLQEAWLLNGFGTGYTDFGVYERAQQCYEEALAIFEDLGEQVGAARALTGLGTICHRMGRYEEALPYHERSLTRFIAAGNAMGEARALNDLGVVYHHLGDTERAIRLHRQSLGIREEIGNRQAQSTSLIHLGDSYLRHGDVEAALGVLHQALAIAEAVKARPRIYQAHSGLAAAYEHKGEWQKALHHHKAYHQVHEGVLGEEAQARINRLLIRLDVENAEQTAEIERLRNVELKQKNEELAKALHELKRTQDQLIHAEKMASLGQLTAGIAHEIKNPLNFVTNFSQLSIELADELEEELDVRRDASVEVALPEVQALLADLKFNAERIYEHGRRADDIVKSMLLHARGAPGASYPIDLNALLKKYVNLAYHGMRAQADDFNCTIGQDYDEAVGQVAVVPQEIARVFLNLLNNAFYAVYKRIRVEGTAYTPTVQAATRTEAGAVIIQISDNGPGIPSDLREKIFEPFFTTKPAGAGTGLGLSLSYDIITQGHGGTLSVESIEGKGTTFTIMIPTSATP